MYKTPSVQGRRNYKAVSTVDCDGVGGQQRGQDYEVSWRNGALKAQWEYKRIEGLARNKRSQRSHGKRESLYIPALRGVGVGKVVLALKNERVGNENKKELEVEKILGVPGWLCQLSIWLKCSGLSLRVLESNPSQAPPSRESASPFPPPSASPLVHDHVIFFFLSQIKFLKIFKRKRSIKDLSMKSFSLQVIWSFNQEKKYHFVWLFMGLK